MFERSSRPRYRARIGAESEESLVEHFVRIGVLGTVDRLRSMDGVVHQRGTRVICRTKRGLEIGTVLNISTPSEGQLPSPQTRNASAKTETGNLSAAGTSQVESGSIIRRATGEDHLLAARLEKNRIAALLECERILASRADSSLDLVLVDVELLFDGQTIFFYFLGDNPQQHSPKLESLTQELAAAYEAKVELRRFAETLDSGCGPECGTDAGCGDSGGCTSCALLSHCRD